MNWGTWTHLVKNKKDQIVFSGPFDDCVSFFVAGSGPKYGWKVVKGQESTQKQTFTHFKRGQK